MVSILTSSVLWKLKISGLLHSGILEVPGKLSLLPNSCPTYALQTLYDALFTPLVRKCRSICSPTVNVKADLHTKVLVELSFHNPLMEVPPKGDHSREQHVRCESPRDYLPPLSHGKVKCPLWNQWKPLANFRRDIPWVGMRASTLGWLSYILLYKQILPSILTIE